MDKADELQALLDLISHNVTAAQDALFDIMALGDEIDVGLGNVHKPHIPTDGQMHDAAVSDAMDAVATILECGVSALKSRLKDIHAEQAAAEYAAAMAEWTADYHASLGIERRIAA